jgi:hypothetical protein
MTEAVNLFFGMSGDGIINSKISAMNRNFKSFDRTAKGFGRLGQMAMRGGSVMALAGAGRSILSGDNLAMLRDGILRPMRLDMRKLARFARNTETFKKLKDYIDKGLANVASRVAHMAKGIGKALSKLPLAARAATMAATVGSAAAAFFGARGILRGGLWGIRNIARNRGRASQRAQNLLNYYNTRQSQQQRNNLLRNMGYSPAEIARRGPDIMARESRILQRSVNRNRFVSRVAGSAAIGYRRGVRAIGNATTSTINIASIVLSHWSVKIAAGLVAFFASADRRVGAFVAKWGNKLSLMASRITKQAATGWSYIIKKAAYSITGSKYMAFDSSKLVAEQMKKKGINDPTQIRRWVEHNLAQSKKEFANNFEDFKKNLLEEVNNLAGARIKAIDDLLAAQMRESRL